jgi:hypothetical protein
MRFRVKFSNGDSYTETRSGETRENAERSVNHDAADYAALHAPSFEPLPHNRPEPRPRPDPDPGGGGGCGKIAHCPIPF